MCNRSALCPAVYPTPGDGGSTSRAQRGAGAACWPTPAAGAAAGPGPLRCYEEPVSAAAAVHSFTAWRHNLLAISAAAAAAGSILV